VGPPTRPSGAAPELAMAFSPFHLLDETLPFFDVDVDVLLVLVVIGQGRMHLCDSNRPLVIRRFTSVGASSCHFECFVVHALRFDARPGFPRKVNAVFPVCRSLWPLPAAVA
jgi:hypothetical protein